MAREPMGPLIEGRLPAYSLPVLAIPALAAALLWLLPVGPPPGIVGPDES